MGLLYKHISRKLILIPRFTNAENRCAVRSAINGSDESLNSSANLMGSNLHIRNSDSECRPQNMD